MMISFNTTNNSLAYSNSSVQDFTEITTTKVSSELYPQYLLEKKDRLVKLKKVAGIFSDIAQVKREILNSPLIDDDNFTGGVREFYVNRGITPYTVHFKEGKVQEELITDRKFTYLPQTIKKIVIAAMEKLAEELKWCNVVRELACNAVNYRFSQNSSEPLSWHCDEVMDSSAEHSFIILLSDPKNLESGWRGGDLLYTRKRYKNILSFKPNDLRQTLSQFNSTKGEFDVLPNSPCWRISPSQNDGILFGNRGMVHKVTKMVPLQQMGERMILTIFDFGDSQ